MDTTVDQCKGIGAVLVGNFLFSAASAVISELATRTFAMGKPKFLVFSVGEIARRSIGFTDSGFSCNRNGKLFSLHHVGFLECRIVADTGLHSADLDAREEHHT
eukprot:1366205-Amorphochlora_amoeboformis.AAC.1